MEVGRYKRKNYIRLQPGDNYDAVIDMAYAHAAVTRPTILIAGTDEWLFRIVVNTVQPELVSLNGLRQAVDIVNSPDYMG